MRYVLLLLLTGCATTEGITLANGRPGYAINCPGTADNWGSCFKKAGEICPKGYDIQQQLGDRGSFVAGSATPSGGSIAGGSIVSRTLIVACK